MRTVLFLSSAVAFALGLLIAILAKVALQEIEAFILFLISAVFFVGGCVVEAINTGRKSIEPGLDGAMPNRTTPVAFEAFLAGPPTRPPAAEPGPEYDELGIDEDASTTEGELGHSTCDDSSDERNARETLGRARDLNDAGEGKQAKRVLKELIRQYPRTQAAEKARRAFARRKTMS